MFIVLSNSWFINDFVHSLRFRVKEKKIPVSHELPQWQCQSDTWHVYVTWPRPWDLSRDRVWHCSMSHCRVRLLSRSVTEICNEILWETLDWCDNNIQWETEPGSQDQDIASGDKLWFYYSVVNIIRLLFQTQTKRMSFHVTK